MVLAAKLGAFAPWHTPRRARRHDDERNAPRYLSRALRRADSQSVSLNEREMIAVRVSRILLKRAARGRAGLLRRTSTTNEVPRRL